MDAQRGEGTTWSELEARFKSLLLDARLPQAELNATLAPDTTTTIHPDCLWRERRDRKLQAAGYRVIRITWRQLQDEPEAILADLRRLLR
jgi:hypothetical protein